MEGGLLNAAISVVIGVVLLTVVVDVLGANVYSGTLNTVLDNVPVLFAVGLLLASIGWALVRYF